MPLPMVHLLTARRWATGKPELWDCPEFYLGTIAPDAIHMRAGVNRDDKRVTHLDVWTGGPTRALNYLSDRSSAFDVGYALHIMTDFYWVRHVRHTFPQLVGPDGRLIGEIYYPDCDQADEGLYSKSPERTGIWRLLKLAAPPEDHPLLSGREIDGWRQRILTGFGVRPIRPARMITFETVRNFIELVQASLTGIPTG